MAETLDPTVMFKQTYGLYIVSSTIGETANKAVETSDKAPVGKAAEGTGKTATATSQEEAKGTGSFSAGCIINTATQVTSNPIQIIIACNNDNETCKVIKQTGHFALSILDQTADMVFIGRFGFRSSLEINKFEGIKTATDMLGDVYTPEHSCGVMACKVEQTISAGTHSIFLARVEAAKPFSSARPLTYDYYHNVLKGKTPPKASSYVVPV